MDIFNRVNLYEKYGNTMKTKAEKAVSVFEGWQQTRIDILEKCGKYFVTVNIRELSDNDKLVIVETVALKAKQQPVPAFICDDWQVFAELLV